MIYLVLFDEGIQKIVERCVEPHGKGVVIYLVSFAKGIEREVWRDGYSERRCVYSLWRWGYM